MNQNCHSEASSMSQESDISINVPQCLISAIKQYINSTYLAHTTIGQYFEGSSAYGQQYAAEE